MRDRSPVQVGALLVGIVFLAVGVLGFVPGITTSYGDMNFIGEGSEAKLLGLFQVNVVHNIVHLLFGIVGIALTRTWGGARTFLIGGGIVYGVLWIYGVVIDLGSEANFVSINTADNWLHLGLSAGMIGLGLVLGRQGASERSERLAHA